MIEAEVSGWYNHVERGVCLRPRTGWKGKFDKLVAKAFNIPLKTVPVSVVASVWSKSKDAKIEINESQGPMLFSFRAPDLEYVCMDEESS